MKHAFSICMFNLACLIYIFRSFCRSVFAKPVVAAIAATRALPYDDVISGHVMPKYGGYGGTMLRVDFL